MAANADRVYEDCNPSTNWKHEPGLDTLVVDLPGFRKQNLKVQASAEGKLRIKGEKQQLGKKWTRFQKEFTTPTDCDVNKIAGKFEGSKLYVKLPKKPRQEIEETEKPATERQPSKNEQQTTTKEAASKAAEDKKAAEEKAKAKGGDVSPKEREKEKIDGEEMYQKTDDKGKKPESAVNAKEENGHGPAGTVSRLMGGLFGKVKQPRKLLDLVLVVLVVLVLGLYIKKGIHSIGTPKND